MTGLLLFLLIAVCGAASTRRAPGCLRRPMLVLPQPVAAPPALASGPTSPARSEGISPHL